MKMLSKNKHTGFTIVELLIVIVVIGILAALVLNSFTSAQAKARNASRASDIAAIQKALEAFRAVNDLYPVSQGPGANLPAGFVAPYGTSAYSYSVATDDSWLKELRLSGYMNSPPKDPINDNDRYYIYLSYTNGTAACAGSPMYVLISYGWEGGTSTMPSNSRSLSCSDGTTVAAWNESDNQAVFSNRLTP